ncbi:glycosyl hydrolase [Aureococcus anophagefferens]|nr:glycosyl hydrolase [Aureococcus anophagefferens]
MRAACLLLILASARSRDSLETILARIDPPTFPPRDFYVHHYGAVPDGSTDALEGFRLAIAAARDAGGGRVVAKGGTFLLRGGLDLYDNVQLYFEGTELFNYHPLIRAFEAENVSVVGADPATSVLDGGGDGWPLKAPKDAKKLRELGASNAPVDASVEARQFGGKGLPPSFVQPFRCRRVSLANFSLVNAPFWAVHPVYSESVWVRNLRVTRPGPAEHGRRRPEACKDVLVENCVISAGDDAVALKTGRDADGWRVGVASENIVVRRNVLASRFNGICVGSEVSGGVDNVFFLENRIERAFHAIFVKSNSERGSFVRYVHVAHVKAYDLEGDCIHFTNDYKGVRGTRPTTFEKFAFKDVICRSAVFAVRATSLAESPIADVTIRDVIVKSTLRTTPDHPVSHPVAVANVANWDVANLRVNGQAVDLSNRATVAYRKRAETSSAGRFAATKATSAATPASPAAGSLPGSTWAGQECEIPNFKGS